MAHRVNNNVNSVNKMYFLTYGALLLFLYSCESKQFAAYTRKVCIPELTVAWSRELSSGPYAAVPLIADVDADGQLDVAVASFTGDVHVIRGSDSEDLPDTQWPFRLSDTSVHSSPLQYDVNNDGLLDLLICTTDGQLVFIDAAGKLINIHQLDGLWLRGDWYKHRQSSSSSVVVGHDDIEQYISSSVNTDDRQGWVQLAAHVLSTPVIDDVDSDGRTEELVIPVSYYLDHLDDSSDVGGNASASDVVVSSVVYVNLTSLQTYLSVRLELTPRLADRPAYLLSSPTIADIDQSRRGLEAVIASSTGHIYLIDSVDGRTMFNYPLALSAAIHNQVLVEDVNNDGQLELIVYSSDGNVLCYSALSASLLWHHQLSQPVSLTIDLRLVDLDNDLHIVAAADDGKLWLLRAQSGAVVGGWPVSIARQLNTAPLITRLYPLELTLLVIVDTDGVLHAMSLDRSCQYHVDIAETSLVSLVSHDLQVSAGVELLLATSDGTVLCLSPANNSQLSVDSQQAVKEIAQMTALPRSHNDHVFSDNLFVSIDSSPMEHSTYTFTLDISIIDTRLPSSAPYNCQVSVGSLSLYQSTLTSPGSHLVTITSPAVPMSGHLLLRCHNRHGKLLQDTCSVTFYHTSLSDLQWLLFTPTLAMSVLLLFLLGFPTANILPVTINTKRQ